MTVLFTEEHARILLATLTTLDQRFHQPDETLASLRAGAWSKVLAEVDPRFAMRHVELAYSEPRDYQLQVGEIRQAWAEQQATARAESVRAAEAEEPAELIADPSMIRYVREVLHAAQDGTPMPPRPTSLRTLTAAAEQRSRRCTYWDLCACDHTVCRGGFLDAEEVVINGLGRHYTAVRRCAHCNDALLMAEESGRAKRPATTARGRR